MEIRPATPADLKLLDEVDGTIRSQDYLHVEQAGSGLDLSWNVRHRPLREAVVLSNPIGDELRFALRQTLGGSDEGTVLIAIHDDAPAAMLFARPRHHARTLRLVDLRVDFDFRRQGIATAMLFMLIGQAREREFRAVDALASAQNGPACRMLSKSGFDLAGLDTRRHSNHDLVKESATLLWYAALD